MTDELVARLVRAEDWGQVDELFLASSGISYGAEYWHWKFLEHPWNRGSPLAVATFDGDRMVSFFATLPMRILSPEGILQANQILDLLTATKYRRMGLFRKEMNFLLGEMRRRKDVCSLGFAGENAGSTSGLVTMNYKHVCNLARSVKIYDPAAFVNHGPGGLGTRIARKLFSKKAKGTYGKLPPNIHIASEPKDFTEIFDKNILSSRFSVERSEEYIEWRSKNPRGHYLFLVKEGKGFLMLGIRDDDGLRHGVIMDCVSSDEESVLELMKAVDYVAAEKRLAVVRSQSFSNSKFHSLLDKAGFARQSGRTAFILCNLENIPGMEDKKNWHITVSDTDHA
ncbi:MAG: GNAT family N-acetyltransferase [Candidatus Thermoplasmatota archaeon]|nr:GNAT family N-acetyltransferase [Candidatus Thermoplasmatota archaeon]